MTIGNGVTNLAANALGGCVSLTSVTIPGSVTSIGTNAFDHCTNLSSVYFMGQAPVADSSLFTRDAHVNVYYMPDTSGWYSPFGGVPASLWNPSIEAGGGNTDFGVRNGQFGFSFAGPANANIVVEASPSLTTPAWAPLQTVTSTNGNFHFSEPAQGNVASRFYRLRFP